LAAAGVTYQVGGPPPREVPCRPESLKSGEICLSDVMARWNGKVLWIDARQRADWEKSGVAGSLLWNLAEDQEAFEIAAMERLVDGLPVIVYCDTASCGVSAQIADRIRGLGIAPEVHSLQGGAEALRAAGMLK
jgi:rhodanese-related sulfurtransferase